MGQAWSRERRFWGWQGEKLAQGWGPRNWGCWGEGCCHRWVTCGREDGAVVIPRLSVTLRIQREVSLTQTEE